MLYKSTPVNPNHEADADFSRNVQLPNGIVKAVQIDFRGTIGGTLATPVGNEGLTRLVSRLRLEFPRPDERNYVIEAPLRDLLLISKMLTGRAPLVLFPTSAGAAYVRFTLPLGIYRKRSFHPWGIDTRELSGPCAISGRFESAVNYDSGADPDLTTGRLRVSFEIDKAEAPAPRIALLPRSNRVEFSSAQKWEQALMMGDLDGAFGLFIRMFDASGAINADRPDGLLKALRVEHSSLGTISNDVFSAFKEMMANYFGITNAELSAAAPSGFAGCIADVWNPELVADRYLPVRGGRTISVELDGESTVETGITGVTPAAGDYAQVTVLGAQASMRGQE